MAFLEGESLLDYNVFISAEIVRECLGLEYPEVGTKREFDQLGLAEMAAVDYCRNILLGRGMYLRQVQGGYRILTIGENVKQVDLYMDAAERKIRRGQKLLRNTPREVGAYPDQQEVRAELKREAIRAHRQRYKDQPSAS
jgi:hypothetical protein